MRTETTGAGVRQGRNFHTLVEAGAVLYIAESDELDALKVGVTSLGSRTNRVRQHARHGWHATAEIPFDDGRHAFVAEQAVLAFLRACGARETLRQDQLPQGGYTETVAFARLAGIGADELLVLARIAAGVLEATTSTLYGFMTAAAEIETSLARTVDEIQALRRAGRRQEADKLADEFRLAAGQVIEHLQVVIDLLA